jgi:hypothetical protein
MEECIKLGLAKSIGISNFNTQQINRILEVATIKPAVNQVTSPLATLQLRFLTAKTEALLISHWDLWWTKWEWEHFILPCKLSFQKRTTFICHQRFLQ